MSECVCVCVSLICCVVAVQWYLLAFVSFMFSACLSGGIVCRSIARAHSLTHSFICSFGPSMSKFWCLFLLLSPPLPPYRYSKCISLGKVCVCETLLFLTRTPVRAYSFVHSTRKFSQIIPVCRKVCVLFVMRCIWRRAWSIRR